MNVVVTGGCGLLGSYVVAEIARGHNVVVVDTNVKLTSAKMLSVDIRDPERLANVFSGQDAVVHLAGIDSATDAAPAEMMSVNSFGTLCVFEAAASCGITNIVYCSSASVYGLDHSNPGHRLDYLPVDEHHPLQSTAPYGLSKFFGEVAGERFAARYGMSVTALRVSAVVFPSTMDELRTTLNQSEFVSKTAGIDRQQAHLASYNVPLYRSYVEASDAARAHRLALERPSPGFHVYNVCANDTLIRTPTLEMTDSIYGKPVEVRDVTRYRKNPCSGIFSNLSAKADLGWTPQNSFQAMAKTDRK